MTTASATETRERFEIKIGRDRYNFDNGEGDRMRVLNEEQFMDLLQDRLGKTVSEIQELLACYQESAGKI